MSNLEIPEPQRIELRKYPNRRYYDITRSQHVTLEAIHRLILLGHEVVVTDSKTGEDITTKVLAQIIFDHDPLKLAVFPAPLLHKVIRANEPLVREFVEKYFNRALEAFLESQRQFERHFRESLGLGETLAGADWGSLMFRPFLGMSQRPVARRTQGADTRRPEESDRSAAVDTELQRQLDALQQQIEMLRQELARR